MSNSRLSYDPWEIPPEERQATFVGREGVVTQLLAAVGEQAGHATIQHYLILGPRGIGKTTLLLTLRERVRADPTLAGNWCCVQLREEEYCIQSLRDLFERVLRALSEDECVPDAADLAARVAEERDGPRSLAIAVDGLRSLWKSSGKRVLLLIDNFDKLFPDTHTGRRKARAADNEYRAFRKLLSKEGFLMVVGASVRLFEDIAAYDKAFFNFFLPVEVPCLSDVEVTQLVLKRAEAEENSDFLRKFDVIKDKLRAITHITGGNPRLVVMLYDVLSHRELPSVVQALRETIAGLTPMLKHVLDDMPRQQSKTLDALVRLGGANSPTAIAHAARLSPNVVTTQLGRLKEARFLTLEGGGKGSPATYRVADRMFETWYQMRYLRPARRRIEMLVEFLRAWFSKEERKRVVEEECCRIQEAGVVGSAGRIHDLLALDYYLASLEDAGERKTYRNRLADTLCSVGRHMEAAPLLAESAAPDGASQSQYRSAGFRAVGDRLLARGELRKAQAAYEAALRKNPLDCDARLGLGVSLGRLGDHGAAQCEFERILTNDEASHPVRTLALENRASSRAIRDDYHGAIADFDLLLLKGEMPPERTALALFHRGVCREKLRDEIGAIADYTRTAVLPDAPSEHVAAALMNRGVRRGRLGDHEGEISDYAAVEELGGAKPSQVAQARSNRGLCRELADDYRGAIADYTTAIQSPGALPEVLGKALFNRGKCRSRLGDSAGAMADYSSVLEVPGVPAAAAARALVNRGCWKSTVGDLKGAMEDFGRTVALKDSPADQVAKAQFNLGKCRQNAGDYQTAIADYTRAVDLPGAPVEVVGSALCNRGACKGSLGDFQGEISDYTAVVELPGATVNQVALALVNRGARRGNLDDVQGELDDYTAVLELSGAAVEHVSNALYNRAVRKALLGDIHGAIGDYSAVLDRRGASSEIVAMALVNRGICRRQLGDPQGAVADYSAVIELAGMPIDHVGEALFNRGVCKWTLGDREGAMSDYTAIIGLTGAPADLSARALANRSAAYGISGDPRKSLEDCEAGLAYPGIRESVRAGLLLNRGLALTELGDSAAAMQAFGECLAVRTGGMFFKAFSFLIRGLLREGRLAESVDHMARLNAMEPAGSTVKDRVEARLSVIVDAGKAHSLDAAAALLVAANANDPEEIRSVLSFLKPAIDFARTGNPSVLAGLPDQERESARTIAANLLQH